MAESRDYMTLPEEKGTVNISEEVLAAVVVGAVREVEGVSGMMTPMGAGVNTANARKSAKGVKIDMSGDALSVDIYLMVEYGHPIPEVAGNVQNSVFSSIEAMTGCPVEAVNVHVGGVSLA
ncbi:MAG: Asp23/Gls24 family envelope stress response protein [Oscillospiraceae bacterium]|nr:Asp23/Gls24 family envelope stress response protein [Oscillospiraceae bacterium]